MAPTSKSTKTSQLKRNERERKRVNQVNDGFDQLRERVSKVTANKKLSKADTLREAVKYIQYLKDLLQGDDCGYQHNDYMMPPAMPSFPSPPTSFYDDSSYYSSPSGIPVPHQMQLTPPQQPSPSDFYLHHHNQYQMPSYPIGMRPSP